MNGNSIEKNKFSIKTQNILVKEKMWCFLLGVGFV